MKEIKQCKRLPVVNLAAVGIATPADAVLMMQLGSGGVFVGSASQLRDKSQNPKQRAIVEVVSYSDEPRIVTDVSKGLGDATKEIKVAQIPEDQKMRRREL